MDISNYISFKNHLISHQTYFEMKETLKMILNSYKIKKNKYYQNDWSNKKKIKKSTKKNIRVILTKGIGKMFVSKIKDKKKICQRFK